MFQKKMKELFASTSATLTIRTFDGKEFKHDQNNKGTWHEDYLEVDDGPGTKLIPFSAITCVVVHAR